MKKFVFLMICSLVSCSIIAQRQTVSAPMKRESPVKIATVPMTPPTPTPVGEPIEIKNLTAKGYQKKFEEMMAKGYRPIKVEVKRLQVIDYTDGEVPTVGFWATFQKYNNDYPWVARHNLSSKKYQEEFDTWVPQGYMPISIGVGAVDENEVYAVIFEKRPKNPAWEARHNLSLANFSAAHQDFIKQGYKLKVKTSCAKKGGTIYAAIWTK